MLAGLSLASASIDAASWQPLTQGMPAGAVMYYAGRACPAGWLEANGAALNGAYPALEALVGENLPDLRGLFLRGLDNGRGIDPGRQLGSYQMDEVRGHQHGLPAAGSAAAGSAISVLTPAGAGPALTAKTGGAETRPMNMALLVCIKT